MSENSEYEQLTVRLSRKIMGFLKKLAKKQNLTPEEYAEKTLVEMVNVDIDENPLDQEP